MPTLKITCAGPNPQTVDLSQYLMLAEDAGLDNYDPAFTQRVFSRSLLKEGASLPLVQLVEKEQQWPVILGPYANQPAMANAIAQINQVITTPGAVVSWQDDGMSQPTYFDLIVGELQILYSYRKAQRAYTKAKLLTFSQPLGRTAAPRPYAAASAVGPLLMISPYASSGLLTIGASTQGGVAGFGGQQQGASSGVFYWGSPSLAGDAPAQLQVSYVGPLPAGATATGVTPTVAVSLLPDALYTPLITASQITFANLNSSTSRGRAQTAVASSYISLSTLGTNSVFDAYSFSPVTAADIALEPTLQWSGQHRLFAIARASGAGGPVSAALIPQAGPLMQSSASVAVGPVGLDWAPYDLGTFALRPSESPQGQIQVQPVITCTGASGALDVAAFVMLPDATTWFMNPTRIDPTQYGYPPKLASSWGAAPGAWSNTIILDDVLGDQFIYSGEAQTFAPSPIGAVPSATRMSQFTRGLVPRPDPKNGLPIIAILGVGRAAEAAIAAPISFPTYSSGPNSPSAAANDAANGATETWAVGGGAPTLAAAVRTADSLTTFAQALANASTSTEWLKATNYGFAIPAGAVIAGIQATIYYGPNHETANPLAFTHTSRLVRAGVVQAAAPASSRSDGYAPDNPNGSLETYGGLGDLWGAAWTPADVNNAGFGFAFSVTAGPTYYQYTDVDLMQITVYYTFGTPPVSFPGASQANPQNLRSMAQVTVLERARYVHS